MFGIYVTIPVMYSITHITEQMRPYEHRSTSFYWNVLYDKNNKQIRHDSDDAEIGVIPYAILLSKRRPPIGKRETRQKIFIIYRGRATGEFYVFLKINEKCRLRRLRSRLFPTIRRRYLVESVPQRLARDQPARRLMTTVRSHKNMSFLLSRELRKSTVSLGRIQSGNVAF